MAGQADLLLRGEKAQVKRTRFASDGPHKAIPWQANLASDRLHLSLLERCGSHEHTRGIPLEWHAGEDVNMVEGKGGHIFAFKSHWSLCLDLMTSRCIS